MARQARPKDSQSDTLVLTAKLEMFAQCVARGMTQSLAAVEAGYKPSDAASRGSKLMLVPAVAKRVEVLRKAVADQRLRSVESIEMPHREGILRDLVATRDMATKQNNLMARLKANEMLGKELGMFRQSVDMAISSPLDGMRREELLALASLFRPGGARLIEGNVVEIEAVPGSDVSRETQDDRPTFDDDDPLA